MQSVDPITVALARALRRKGGNINAYEQPTSTKAPAEMRSPRRIGGTRVEVGPFRCRIYRTQSPLEAVQRPSRSIPCTGNRAKINKIGRTFALLCSSFDWVPPTLQCVVDHRCCLTHVTPRRGVWQLMTPGPRGMSPSTRPPPPDAPPHRRPRPNACHASPIPRAARARWRPSRRRGAGRRPRLRRLRPRPWWQTRRQSLG